MKRPSVLLSHRVPPNPGPPRVRPCRPSLSIGSSALGIQIFRGRVPSADLVSSRGPRLNPASFQVPANPCAHSIAQISRNSVSGDFCHLLCTLVAISQAQRDQ